MIYLHIPFCATRCIYCDFYSTVQTAEMRARFVHALCEELRSRADELPDAPVKTIYWGGGTPSQLALDEVTRVMDCLRQSFVIADGAEITMEANPDEVTPEWVVHVKALGVNRISLGVQSLDDRTLRLLRRRHSAAEAAEAVQMIVAGGITNVSIDLMYGLPKQTLADFERDVQQALTWPIKHLSSYALSVETGTALDRLIQQGVMQPATDEVQAAEYAALRRLTQAAGWVHYELSNFALPDYHSRHNSAYWTGQPYLGCGPGAHSFDGERRRLNRPNLLDYVEAAGNPPHEVEVLTPTEHFNEYVFTALRTRQGLSLQQVVARHGEAVMQQLLLDMAPHLRAGRLVQQGDVVRLTPQGLFVSDDVMCDLMRV